MNGLNLAVAAFLFAFGIAAMAAAPIFRLLLALKSRQTVSVYVTDHAHKQGTPTMGGFIIAIGFLSALLLGILSGGEGAELFTAAFGLFASFLIIGFVDDFVVPRLLKGKRGLGWTQKLTLQIAFSLAAVWFSGTPNAGYLILGVFLILFFSNAYNFADGIDGLAAGLLLAMVAGFAAIAYAVGVGAVAAMLLALAGASLPFLFYNRYPARLFMGDVGALPIGAVIGLAVYVTALAGAEVAKPVVVTLALLVTSVMMLVELVPVPLQILSVKLRGKRLFPMTPIHHAFQKAGWKEKRIVAAFVGVQCACSLIGAVLAWSAR